MKNIITIKNIIKIELIIYLMEKLELEITCIK